MNPERVDLVLKYALARAAQEEGRRELGAIHLLKLVFLADLAFAERNGGKTFTGSPWRFYKFGPYAEAVLDRLPPSLAAIGAIEKRIPSVHREGEFVRYRVIDMTLADQLERDLPVAVCSAVKRAVHEFGDDTKALLHFVYTTKPMLRAAPHEVLDFSCAVRQKLEVAAPAVDPESTKAKKRRKERLEEVRSRIRELRARPVQQTCAPVPEPRYDEEFRRGVEWMDQLAGERMDGREGRLTFSEGVWHSPARTEDFDEDP